MTPQEKAVELFNNYFRAIPFANEVEEDEKVIAKRCALIAVDEILKEVLPIGARNGEERTKEIYWQQVKTELQNL